MKFIKRALLPFTVLVTGGCVLIIEIAAIRILAPYFGSTIFSVSSVISVVLAALSAGYWFGGRLADKYPRKKLFFAIITFSGIAVLFIQFLQAGLLPVLGYALPLTIGPLIVSMLLFFVPSFVLGMLSPFAIALQQREAKNQGVGTTSGQIFFFSTVGSIAGSLLAGFALIPFFGVTKIILGVGAVLFLLGSMPLLIAGMERKIITAVFLAAGGLVMIGLTDTADTRVLYNRDGLYEKIIISNGVYNDRPARFLMQDTSNSAAAYLDTRDDSDLVFDYSKFYALHEVFVPKVERALVIGGGAYSIPKVLLKNLPDAKVDVSEIEPSLVPLSKQYFGLNDDPRLAHYIKDGRRMLHDTSHRYDLIFGDAYRSMYSVPYHITTKEFMQLAHDRLTENGAFFANLIGSTDTSGQSFIWSEVKTIREIFPQVYVFPVEGPDAPGTQNIVVVASKRKERLDIKNQPAQFAGLLNHYLDTTSLSFDQYPALTDDYAPVDYLIAKFLPKR